MSAAKVLMAVGVTAVLGSITSALNSPCPDLFRYESTDQPGQWSGTVTLLSDADLYGVWLRLIFDGKLTELRVADKFGEVVPSDNHQEYLIKNRNFILTSSNPKDIKITVKYDGNEAPKLTGFRLNAQAICSSENALLEHFAGDLNNKDFLKSLKSDEKAFDQGCGTVPQSADNEVKNGRARSGQWPWQGAIYIRKNNKEEYVCGASLVSSQHVLTAAHCVAYLRGRTAVPPRLLAVGLGGEKFGVQGVALHPAFRAGNLLSDLAVVRVDRAVVSDRVRPICLRKSFDRRGGFLLGHGMGRDNKIEDLAQAEVEIIREDECHKQRADLKALLTDNVLCASYVEDNLICVGDSGSSLVSLSEGPKKVWELKGVVTVGATLQGKSKCDNSSIVLFADVNNYLSWIQSVISE